MRCPLLPDPRALRCEQVQVEGNEVRLFVVSIAQTSRCPGCGVPSSRVHSRYTRTLGDLPWHGAVARLIWHSRKFFCDRPDCPQRVFTERQPKVALPYGRQTARLNATLTGLAFACGGEPGVRLAERLGLPTSGDTLLRRIRQRAETPASAPKALGVDDWALRKGQRYGTIMCDLETHQAVDLMPERSTESFQAWLEAHPDVEIISRDRGDCYIKGATLGAPNATQVADRWHLLRNLSEATERVVSRHHPAITSAIKEVAKAVPSVETDPGPETEQPAPASGRAKRLVEQKAERRARRLERYNTVVDLHSRGIAIREIARRSGMNRNTVKRFAQAGQFPERAHTQRKSQIDPFIEYLHQRWSEGCRNAAQLTQELIKRGYRGSSATVRRCVAGWRKPAPTETSPKRTAPSPTRPPSTRRLAWILVNPGGKVSADDLRLRRAICQQVPRLKVASRLGRWFTRLVCGRREPTFDAWLKHARHSDLKTFAEGLLADEAAVRAALTVSWSNGQVEGHINRLKLLKRQMYGRASFDLLRRRFLYAG